MLISSTKNPRIKEVLKLEKASHRKKTNRFVIEGIREIERAVESGYELKEIFYCPELMGQNTPWYFNESAEHLLTEISANVFARLAYRDKQDGVLALASMKSHGIEDLKLPEDALVLVAEGVEKPGNMGALLRSADGAGLDAMVFCNSQTDLYNPNVIRASLGCVFSNRIIQCNSTEAIAHFRRENVRIYSAALQDSVLYYDADFQGKTAIAVGSEADGLSQEWRKHAEKLIRIPMKGMADSLNVSVSAGILIFEAIRQRELK